MSQEDAVFLFQKHAVEAEQNNPSVIEPKERTRILLQNTAFRTITGLEISENTKSFSSSVEIK
jgi:hypothetical protein